MTTATEPRAMRAVQITRFGGSEVLDAFAVSSAGIDFADTRHALTRDVGRGAV